MALEGSLMDFGLADILQLIYFQKKSGILTLSSRKDKVRITFLEGNIVSADSGKRTEENRLGRSLVKKGLISDDDLQAAIGEQKSTGMKLGDLLVGKRLVAREDIAATVSAQVTEAITQLFSWKEGAYEFQVQPAAPNAPKGDMPLTLDTQHLLMEGLRFLDEWSQIEGKVTLDMVFRRTEAEGIPLTPAEESILTYIDGENDVSIIIDLSGLNDFEALKNLVSLIEKGLIEHLEVSPVVGQPVVPPSVVRGRRTLRFLPLAILITALAISVAAPSLRKDGSAGMLSILPGPSFKKLETVRDIDILRFRVEEFRYRNGSYPADIRQLRGENDVWGRPYLYRVEQEGVFIVSAGPDGKIGTADDVY